jgi:hypothetical protein
MKIEVSNGEILDKLSIVAIKLNKISDINKKTNLEKEYNILWDAFSQMIDEYGAIIGNFYVELKDINQKLWDVENSLRKMESEKNFGEEFVFLARNMYIYNDIRYDIKRNVNLITDSNIKEEKSYKNEYY